MDGVLLALSPWAVRNLRFDESLVLGYGFDVDFCLQARAAGRRVRIADLRVIHHRPLELAESIAIWIEAHIRAAEKWDDWRPGDDPDSDAWRQRARRAEAEREAAQTIAYSAASHFDAQVRPLQNRVTALGDSRSWRLTAPLRQLNRRLRAKRARDADGPGD